MRGRKLADAALRLLRYLLLDLALYRHRNKGVGEPFPHRVDASFGSAPGYAAFLRKIKEIVATDVVEFSVAAGVKSHVAGKLWVYGSRHEVVYRGKGKR